MATHRQCLQHYSLGEKEMQLKNPGKQRKRHFNAPAHIRHKMMAAPLSAELAMSRGAKTMPVRKGDTVRIQRGDNKGFEGKVSRVDLKAYRIYIEGLTREKVDGTNIFLPIHPSKVEIRNLTLDDKLRKKVVDRKVAPEKSAKKAEKAKAKPAKKAPAKEEVEEEAATEVSEKAQSVAKVEEEAEEKAAPKRAKKASVNGGE
jgi:large subunit ribosomal protein L24